MNRRVTAEPHNLGASLAALAVALLLFQGCASPTTSDESEKVAGRQFSSLADRFIESSSALTQDLNTAFSTGNFVAVSDSVASRIITLSDTLSEMDALLSRIHPDLIEIASEIDAAAREWTHAAREAFDAGLASDAARFAEAREALDRERQRFNLGVRKWNVAIEAG